MGGSIVARVKLQLSIPMGEDIFHRTRSDSVKIKRAVQMQAQAES